MFPWMLFSGFPARRSESWKATVDEVIRLSPEHVSAYSLMFEERSRFSAMLEAGEIMDAGEDVSSRDVPVFGRGYVQCRV